MLMQEKREKLVLDLETKKSFDEVKGRSLELLEVSVVGIYSYKKDEFKTFLEKDIKLLLPYLEEAELVIGFNTKAFDYPVLQPYLDFDLKTLKSLDIFEEVRNRLGFRLSLNNIAQATLGIGKIGSGLDALKYFRQGEIDKLKTYCQQDVFVTRELYEYGRKHGNLLYRRGLRLETIPASWSESKSIDQIMHEAFNERRTVEIDYSSGFNAAGKLTRKIDIYEFEFGRIIAYCHLRKDLRTFNMRRILSAKLTQQQYEIPPSFNKERKLS